MAGYDIYDKTGAGCRIGCFLSLFFLVTDGINVLLLMISQPFDEDCARYISKNVKIFHSESIYQ